MSIGRPVAREQRIALFMPFLSWRGASRVMLYLANGFAEAGFPVDIALAEKKGPLLDDVAPGVRVVDLKSSYGTVGAVPGLVRYLRRTNPAVLMAAMDYVNTLAVAARALAYGRTRVYATCHNALADISKHSGRLRDRFLPAATRLAYRRADGVIAVSSGLADMVARVSALPRERVDVVYNPVVIPGFDEAAAEPLDHPWFAPGEPPVVLGAGSLTAQKDFGTLVRAFARVRRARPARLLILGEGDERAELGRLVESLDLTNDVAFGGRVANPLPYMEGAGVFVLSSRWEGFGLVLAEALACGARVVSTACPEGPREILENGRYGELVEVGDAEAMAEAILRALVADDRGDAEAARQDRRRRGHAFSLEAAVDGYLRIFGLRGEPVREGGRR